MIAVVLFLSKGSSYRLFRRLKRMNFLLGLMFRFIYVFFLVLIGILIDRSDVESVIRVRVMLIGGVV